MNTIFFQDEVALPMLSMYTRGVQLVTGRVNARTVLPEALRLIVDCAFQPQLVTDAVVAWRDAADALMAEQQKLVIRP